ncbi:hypothetical protein SLEP1_g21294 [Rubroshorea leprosula]|uniref:Uncharacterized protein n=1 Tax=Rubroshorea leprosula TaxID=152421 RepID=A0AAV5JG44_9ROSI|nr:hypothetical protein SLEP1_g21294 [Rubroshorea leprosula]
MGRRPCCSKEGLNRGAWTSMEDKILTEYIRAHGDGQWRDLPTRAGLKRCGKSCRLRWLNYLRPDIKRGNITHDEEELIIRLHRLLGNRWSLIAGRLPGRTDNEIKNYWNTKISRKMQLAAINIRGQNHRSTTCKSLNQSQKQPNPTVKPSSLDFSKNSTVIHTKAGRCTKVVITNPQRSEPHNTDHHHQINSSEFVSKENERLDLIMDDLEVNESFLLSDLLDIEFGIVPQQLNNGAAGHRDASTPGSNSHSFLFPDDMMHESSDFSSMAFLVEGESNWLQN